MLALVAKGITILGRRGSHFSGFSKLSSFFPFSVFPRVIFLVISPFILLSRNCLKIGSIL